MTVLPITPRSYFSSTPKSSHSLSGSFARSPLPALHHKEGWRAGEPVATGAASSDATGAASSSSVTWHSLVRTVSCNAFKGGGALEAVGGVLNHLANLERFSHVGDLDEASLLRTRELQRDAFGGERGRALRAP
jgi:hypothetical protein